jgi:phosphoribosylanthranilate isomerase
MSKLKIKVCGMRDRENIIHLAKLGPDLMGFVFYPSSLRFAGDIPANRMFDNFPSGISRTGVFVDADITFIKARIERFGLSVVQLHGFESPEICKQLIATGVKVIKAFSISREPDFSLMREYVSCTSWFLFDTSTKIPGGSGKQFEWKLLDRYELDHPFFLSGGIGPGDAERILSLRNPALSGVDINSKFEIEPGVKDIDKVRGFIQEIKGNVTKKELRTKINDL